MIFEVKIFYKLIQHNLNFRHPQILTNIIWVFTSEYQSVALTKLENLTAELLDVKKLLLQVLSSDRPSISAFETTVLPIKSRDELLKLEANLSEKQSFGQLVSRIQ
jgi:hypothetical protein